MFAQKQKRNSKTNSKGKIKQQKKTIKYNRNKTRHEPEHMFHPLAKNRSPFHCTPR